MLEQHFARDFIFAMTFITLFYPMVARSRFESNFKGQCFRWGTTLIEGVRLKYVGGCAMENIKPNSRGLTTTEAKNLQLQYEKNELSTQKKESFICKILHIISEPMFLLLLGAAVIYFIFGEPRDGAIMLIFVVAIISIDVAQEWKTDRTLNALKDLSSPQILVLRDGNEVMISSLDLVPGDWMMIQEGVKIPADGIILKSSDLCIDESSLTGEAEGVWKTATASTEVSSDYWRKDYCYAGTLVTQGSATVQVDKIGAATEYGKIGLHVSSALAQPTPLERQTRSLVKLCSGIAVFLFLLVTFITDLNAPELPLGDKIITSILSGITLAMAMIPEEFPVILAVFLSMGAWRLAKKQSLVRKLSAVETLGAISVLCVDKTGTITMNKMTVREIWTPDNQNETFVETMGLACEIDAYDPMEKAMLDYCEEVHITKQHLFGGSLISEYAFTSEQKMMGHVWYHDDEIIIAAKGSPERILQLCACNITQQKQAEEKIKEMSSQGLRVIAVGSMKPKTKEDIPADLVSCELILNGLVGLADPPRENIKIDIERCTKAGIRVVMITGDNGITAASIAEKVGIPNWGHIITGDMLNEMSDDELRRNVVNVSIFSRVIPEHKMRIVKALKENGEVVAMTGDGVNDAPALKYADIGIAMGKRGSEVSREAADLILMDDNFSTIVDTVKDGRRIYDNIQKAVGYVFTIHIPIALASLFAPLLGISHASLLLLPLHVVLLELIIDPTCSIVLERLPAEDDIMERAPRDPNAKLLTARILLKSIVQGMVIFFASFGTYYFVLQNNYGNVEVARSMGLASIMLANLFLVQVNGSNNELAIHTLRKYAQDKVVWVINIFTLLGLTIILYTPLNQILALAPLSFGELSFVIGIAAVSVLWIEIIKLFRLKKSR